MAVKQKSAAEQYAELKQNRFDSWLATTFTDDALKNVELFEVKCPSGMVFKCRRLDVEYAANAGQTPMLLSAQALSANDGGSLDPNAQLAAFEKMSPEEKMAAMRVMAQMVRFAAIQPCLVVGPVNGQKNAISVDDLTMEDFGALAGWCQNGGEAASAARTFRRKRR